MRYKFALVVLLFSLQACTAAKDVELFLRHKQSFTLENVREDVVRMFPSVKQLSPSALAARLANRDSLVLLDVRESEEYTVSHLPGAVRIDPKSVGSSIATANNPTQKTVVFYCSVGVRSSKLAQEFQSELMRKGAVSVFNLDGGIFAWHNEKRPLEDSNGATDFVHPFDQKYKKLLRRESLARFETR